MPSPNKTTRQWRGAGRFISCLGFSVMAMAALACGDDNTDETASSSSSANSSGAGGMATTSSTTSSGSGGDGSGGMNPGGYPAGPYGNNVGDTLAFLEFEGYVNPTVGNLGEFKDFSMLDIKNSGSPFVLVHLAAMF